MPSKRTPDQQREYERTRKRAYRAQKAAERERQHRERVDDDVQAPPARPSVGGVESIDGAKRRRAVADADRAEIARDVAAGRLVDRVEVERNLQRAFAAVRSALDSLPRIVAGAVPAEHATPVRAVVERETDRMIDGLRIDLSRDEVDP